MEELLNSLSYNTRSFLDILLMLRETRKAVGGIWDEAENKIIKTLKEIK
jgi:hypothetical protein